MSQSQPNPNPAPTVTQPWTKKILTNSAAALSTMRTRIDSWTNALTGLGTSRDKTTSTLPILDITLSQQTLEALYHGDDISQRIVSAVPDECFRKPWAVVNPVADADADKTVEQRGKDLAADMRLHGARAKLHEAMIWGRLYGLGVILVGIDDGRDPWEPVDWDNVRAVNYLTVLEQIDLVPWRWYADPAEEKFAEVAIYMMQPVGVYVGLAYDGSSGVDGNKLVLVHEERLIRFGGELTSRRLRIGNMGADYSILQKCFRAIQLTNDNWQSVAALMADASQGVLKIKGLIDMIVQQPDIMTQRFAFMDQARSTVRSIVLDADGEEFTREPSHFEGIPDLLQETWKRLAAAARIPVTVLMGDSPSGLNATGESDLTWWYDQIAATQEQIVKPRLELLLHLFAAARGYTDAESWTAVFAPLWEMTEGERAKLHSDQSVADNTYIQAGVLTPEEVALSRFGTGQYTLDTTIDTDSRKRIMDLTLEQLETDAENSLETAKKGPPDPAQLPPGAPPGKGQKALPPGNPSATRGDDFNEADHPRDERGRFGEGNGPKAAPGGGAEGAALNQAAGHMIDKRIELAQAGKTAASNRMLAAVVDLADSHPDPAALADHLTAHLSGLHGQAAHQAAWVHSLVADLKAKAGGETRGAERAGHPGLQMLGGALPAKYRK